MNQKYTQYILTLILPTEVKLYFLEPEKPMGHETFDNIH